MLHKALFVQILTTFDEHAKHFNNFTCFQASLQRNDRHLQHHCFNIWSICMCKQIVKTNAIKFLSVKLISLTWNFFLVKQLLRCTGIYTEFDRTVLARFKRKFFLIVFAFTIWWVSFVCFFKRNTILLKLLLTY